MANHYLSLDLRFVSLVTVVVTLIIFYSLTSQITWAALIFCQVGPSVCNGTSGPDIMYGIKNQVTHGLGGNDFIIGDLSGANSIYGDDGDDTLLGGYYSDYMEGGAGNDKYDGYYGNDLIQDVVSVHETSGDDVISGSYGDDAIYSGGGSDIIYGGPGSDGINPNFFDRRDFSRDFVDCGTQYDSVAVYLADDWAGINCETIDNHDA